MQGAQEAYVYSANEKILVNSQVFLVNVKLAEAEKMYNELKGKIQSCKKDFLTQRDMVLKPESNIQKGYKFEVENYPIAKKIYLMIIKSGEATYELRVNFEIS